MKKTLKKILCIFLLILTLFNFICIPRVNADEDKNKIGITKWDSGIDGLVDGVTGILTWPIRLIAVVIGKGMELAAGGVGKIDGNKGEAFIDLEDILFHNANDQMPILDVNFFKTPTSNNGISATIRDSVAGWYYSIRNLAIIISLLVLVYIGIRMAMSTLAEDKATYKKMLTDWIVGFITIFLLHYIMVATVYTNEALVSALNPKSSNYMNDSDYMGNYMSKIIEVCLDPTTAFLEGTVATIIYVFMSVLIFMYLFTYLKRMLTIAFLMIIAPIITVTYSIDKMGDRKISSIKYMAKRICI